MGSKKITFFIVLFFFITTLVQLSEQQCSKWYTVQSGDTCFSIWTKFGLTEQQFDALNPGINCQDLQIGQQVCVGGTAQSGTTTVSGTSTCTSYYTVKSGDTCYSIWTSHGLTEQQFYALNPGINCQDLQIGQQVCVAGKPGITTPSATLGPPNNTTTNRVVGYFPTWSAKPFSATQAQLLTHVIVAFTNMASDGSLSFDNNGQAVTQVKQTAAVNPNLRVMFSVGGAGNSQYFSNVAANPTVLINSIVSITKNFNLDGVDIDWENPSSALDKANYVLLMQKIRLAFNQLQVQNGRKTNYLISFAGAAGKWTLDPGYDLPGLLTYVDFANVMTYDYYGTWSPDTGPSSPLYGVGAQDSELSVDSTLNYYTCKTKKPSQLNLGIPFYGPFWDNVGGMVGTDPMYRLAAKVNGNIQGGSIAWRDIPSSWNLASASWHNVDKVPYIYDSATKKYLGFENVTSIGWKGQYAAQYNMGGLMIWSLDEDDDQYSMLKAVAQAARGLKNSNTVNYNC